MSTLDKIYAPDAWTARAADPLQSVFALGARLYVSWQFLKSGYLKVTSWDSTLYLFQNEYHTPLLSPHAAAVAGSFGELFFPSLLVLGFMGRLSAVGLLAVNGVAVISYSQVLFAAGSEAALGQHLLWGTLLVYLIIHGPGKLSLDQLLHRPGF
ncbi:MAG: DoxX family protein [Pseudomonadota bacterium]|nr:DoxX family protein [Pseudomonadota bacterium]